MKNYRITVNGTEYEVAVEEIEQGQVPAAPMPAARPVAAPKPAAPRPVAQKPTAQGAQGAVKMSSPMPGKIVAVKTSAGAIVKKGEVILVLEAMKMENEIVAPQDGTVASINVSVGQTVEAGDILASLS